MCLGSSGRLRSWRHRALQGLMSRDEQAYPAIDEAWNGGMAQCRSQCLRMLSIVMSGDNRSTGNWQRHWICPIVTGLLVTIHASESRSVWTSIVQYALTSGKLSETRDPRARLNIANSRPAARCIGPARDSSHVHAEGATVGLPRLVVDAGTRIVRRSRCHRVNLPCASRADRAMAMRFTEISDRSRRAGSFQRAGDIMGHQQWQGDPMLPERREQMLPRPPDP